MPEFIEKEISSILNVKKFIDPWFWDRYTLNPYNGCSFGCVYCDARSDHYHMPEDFENKILIKKEPHTLLNARLTRARTLPKDVVGIGGVTDSYQPAERIYKNTKNCLSVLLKHGYPVHIATKSLLIEKDLGLIDEIGKASWATISVTITSSEPHMSKFLDFRAPAPAKRFQLVERIKKETKNIQTGILLIPVVPYLGDDRHALEDLVKKTKDCGADYLLFSSGMTLRNKQALWFFKNLSQFRPELIPRYEKLYRFSYDHHEYKGLYSPPAEYTRPLNELLLELAAKHQVPIRIKRFLPKDFRKLNYTIAEILFNDFYQDELLGRENKNLFWAAHNIQKLNESIRNVWNRGQLDQIWNVKGGLYTRVEKLLRDLLQLPEDR